MYDVYQRPKSKVKKDVKELLLILVIAIVFLTCIFGMMYAVHLMSIPGNG